MAAKPTSKNSGETAIQADAGIQVADITGKKSTYINRVINDKNAFIDAYQKLKTDRDEGTALDYASTDPLVGITDEDLATSGNPHLDRAMFLAGFGTLDAITALLATSDHLKKLYRFRR